MRAELGNLAQPRVSLQARTSQGDAITRSEVASVGDIASCRLEC